ncbi:hypothetical protein HW555_001276 [Spodoptera exigua]|uniref:Uncharacterized protein n=1 Tax=Spodoptera exigua TaxID=7107 RepID=A0A835L825_SPOEX|nr:hypothetical protein HW555_001276 [Spodoptera exigua]
MMTEGHTAPLILLSSLFFHTPLMELFSVPMKPDTSNSAKIFAVIQFLERPYRDLARYVCVPSSWITERLPNCRVAISYPREDVSVTRNRVRNNELPVAMWPVFMALIKYESDICEALVYKSESDDNEDNYNEADILILKPDKPTETEDVVNNAENQDGAETLVETFKTENKDLQDDEDQNEAEIMNLKGNESLKSENVDIQDNNAEDEDDIETFIIKEDPYEQESMKSEDIGTIHPFEGVENNDADSESSENIPRKSESIDIEEHFGNIDTNLNTVTSMEEQMPRSEDDVTIDGDDDDLDLGDLIILDTKHSESDCKIPVLNNDNMSYSIEGTVLERHIEYSTKSLNIQTIEESLVETNTASTTPTPTTSSEMAQRPTISVVPEQFLRYDCHEQKQNPENSTHIVDGRLKARRLLTETIYSTETMKTRLITKAQIHENKTTFNITGNYPHGEAHAISILEPNKVIHTVEKLYDQNVFNNVSYPLEYTSAQHSKRVNQPIAKSKPKKAPPKKKTKVPTKKVRTYNRVHSLEQRGYTYVCPQDTQVSNIPSQNILIDTECFEQNQHYRVNEQNLPVPVQNLTVDNCTGNIVVRTTTGRNPLILNAPQNNKNTISKSAQHYQSAGNRFSYEFGPNENEKDAAWLQHYGRRSKHTYPPQPSHANQIYGTQQNDPPAMVNYHNQQYSNSSNQLPAEIRGYSVIQHPHDKSLFPRKSTDVNIATKFMVPDMQSTTTNLSNPFSTELPAHDPQLPTPQQRQINHKESIIINHQIGDIQSTPEDNLLAKQDCAHFSCSQSAPNTTFTSVVNTTISSSTDEPCSVISNNPDNTTGDNLSAMQNQPNETREEENSISENNTILTENVSVVANESVPDSTVDFQKNPGESSQACSSGEKVEKSANEINFSSNVTKELESVAAAIKTFELILSETAKTICNQTEAFKARHNKMFECDDEFKNVIETVTAHCESRINEVLCLKSNDRLNRLNNRKRKIINNSKNN